MQHGAAAELLARLPLLRGIGSEFLSAILSISVPQQFATHDILAIGGTSADATLVIVDGQVGLYSDDGRLFGEPLGPGMAISEMAMIVETHHYFSAIAVSDGLALSVSRESLGRFMRKFPWLAADLAKNIGRVLAETAATLHELEEMLLPSEMELLQIEDGAKADLVDAAEDDGLPSAEEREGREYQPVDEDSIANVKRIAARQARQPQANDLLGDLKEAISYSDQTKPEQGRDLMVSPSHAFRQSLARKPQSD